eukprot:m.15267 g.15267  ORF g.15267 m.15267 type:complete len:1098 (+) comp26274_c0_seq1:110-3403(+)
MKLLLLTFISLTAAIAVTKVMARKECKLPPHPVHGSRKKISPTKKGRPPGTKYKFYCETSYKLQPATSEEIRCKKAGEWNKQFPTCECRCIAPEIPKNVEETQEQKADQNCQDTVVYKCIAGAKFVDGNLERHCSRDGIWSGNPPVCELPCPKPKPLDNGNIDEVDRARGTGIVKYSCNKSYYLIGGAVLNCSSEGQWIGKFPQCLGDCLRPKLPIHSDIYETAETFAAGDNVTYYCRDGYKLQGHSKRQCLGKGKWCGFSPTCKMITCPHPTTSVNVIIKSLSASFANFSCVDGYELIGASTLVCMPNGRWNGNPPRCTQDCKLPVDRCKVSLFGWIPSSRSCNNKEIDSQGSHLSFDRNKNQNFKHCTVTCLNTENGYGSVEPRVYVHMKGNYDVTGVRVYGVTEIDKESEAKFKLSELPDVTDIRGFEVYIHKTWPSDQNDRERRQFATQCGNRSDTSQRQSVYEVCCGKAIRGRHLSIHIPGQHRVLSICEVEIFYKSNHCSNERRITKTTEVLRCPDAGSISNGRQLGSYNNNFKIGTAVEYECDRCYELHGDSKITCDSDGTWKYKQFPQCLKKTCTDALLKQEKRRQCVPEDFPNGFLTPQKELYSMKESVVIQCNEGFILHGDPKLTCVGGCLWSAPWPKCTVKNCSRPLPPLHGQITPVEDYYLPGSNISYKCDYGFKIKGEREAICLRNETWNHQPSTCERMQCARPDLARAVLIKPYRDFYPLAYKVEFQCSTDRHKRKGPTSATCRETGRWTTIPTCEDPCKDTPCNESEHRKLILRKNQCECVCQDENDCSEDGQSVCGTDAKTHKSACHLNAHACKTRSGVKVAKNEPCKQGGVCAQPKPSGDCNAYEKKWYFNSQRRQCEKFDYGTCFTGGNLFSTQHECYKTCECQPFCNEPKDKGPCRKFSPDNTRFYFTWTDGQCKQLHYSGCFGNENNFKTEAACKRTCRGQKRDFVLPSQECKDRHSLAIKDACKISRENDNGFLVTATIDSRQIGRFGYKRGFIITVGKKYLGPPRVVEENPEYLVNAEAISCACKPLLEKEEYLLSGFVNNQQKLTFNERSLVYPFSNFRDLDAKVLLECPDIYD